MKKFSFSMQAVLNVNTIRKELREAELALARAALRKAEDELARIKRILLAAMDPEKMLGLVSGNYLLQREKYLKLLKALYKKQEFVVHQAEAEVDMSISRLREADIEVKKMEKSRTKHKARWHEEFLKEEQKIGDEIGTTRTFQKRLAS